MLLIMRLLATSLFLTATAAFVPAYAAPNYHAAGKIEVGGEGGWDYLTVDSAARRLYVSHATHVVVIDLDTNKVCGDIPDTPGVHGIALAPKLGKGFISNGRGNSVTAFDLKTLKATGQVATGQNPDAIYYDAASNRVFTFNGRSKDSTVINAETLKVEGTIALGAKPEFAVGTGDGVIYDNLEDTHQMVVIDAKKMAVSKKYDLTGCESPSGLAMDTAHKRLFSVCDGNVMAISDPVAGKVIATAKVGEGPDAAGFDSARGYAFSSNGDGTLTVVGESGGKYVVLQNATTHKGARTMALDEKTHKVYLPIAEYEAATPGQKRAPMKAGSFAILILGE
jgi:DNA-binding beta-propeller fold protein YncE